MITRKPKSDARRSHTGGGGGSDSIPAVTRHLCGHLPNRAARPAPAAPCHACPPRSPRSPLRFLNHGDCLLAETQRVCSQGGDKAEEKGNQPRTVHKHRGRGPETPKPPQPSGARPARPSCPRTRPGAAASCLSPRIASTSSEQPARAPASQATLPSPPPMTQHTEHPPRCTAQPPAGRSFIGAEGVPAGHARGTRGPAETGAEGKGLPQSRPSRVT